MIVDHKKLFRRSFNFQLDEMARHFYCVIFFDPRNNPSFIRALYLRKEYLISPRFCLLDFKIISDLEKFFSGFNHV
jgi:hypothetical protein